MTEQRDSNKFVRQGVTTPVADTERILVEVPPLVVGYYLIFVTFPRRPEHIGTLEVWKKQAFAKDLWALDEKEDLQFRVQACTPSKKPSIIQKLHKGRKPVPEIIKDQSLSPEKGLEKSTILLGRPCMNFDLHPAGKSVDKKDPHDRYDVKDETLFKIPTYDKSTFMYSEDAAYGRFPRLRLVEAKAGNPDNLARIHCGREWRHSHSSSNLKNGHLIPDADGQWTELTGTHGCIRVSLLVMREIFEVLKPISNLSFGWNDTQVLYDLAPAGSRKATNAEPESPELIGFVYCEEHKDENWCHYSSVEVAVENEAQDAHPDRPPDKPPSYSLCDSTDWTSNGFVEFHKKVASKPTLLVTPEYP